MDSKNPKFFRRQSGQIKAVNSDIQDILVLTKAVVAEVRSKPPPAALFRKPEPGEGSYSMIEGDGDSLTDCLGSLPPKKLKI